MSGYDLNDLIDEQTHPAAQQTLDEQLKSMTPEQFNAVVSHIEGELLRREGTSIDFARMSDHELREFARKRCGVSVI